MQQAVLHRQFLGVCRQSIASASTQLTSLSLRSAPSGGKALRTCKASNSLQARQQETPVSLEQSSLSSPFLGCHTFNLKPNPSKLSIHKVGNRAAFASSAASSSQEVRAASSSSSPSPSSSSPSPMGSKEIGFLGLGIMGVPMARNLIKKGFNVTVWNRTGSKCDALVAEGASKGASPAEVVSKCDITIAMLADPAAALDAVFKEDGGVLSAITAGKAYVDMSTVDAETSQRISEGVTAKGGRFLEAPVSGSKKPAEDATLIILAAGDESLYTEVTPAFDAMGKKSFYLGPVGNGAHMKLVVNMIMGSMVSAFSEGMAVAEKAGLSQQTLLDVLDLGAMANPVFRLKGPAMINDTHPPAFPLKHQQKDLRLALKLGDQVAQTMPVAAAANEMFKLARNMGYGDEDMSAVYKAFALPKASSEAPNGKN